MSSQETPKDETPVEPPLRPDPFGLLKRIQSGVAQCAKVGGCGSPESIEYLWLYVSKTGISRTESRDVPEPLSEDSWLNVIDEAASMGARWLVISAFHNFSDCPEIWKLCTWAQQVHGMLIGLHTNAARLSEAEVADIQRLDPLQTRLLINETALESVQALTDAGVQTAICSPEISEPTGGCSKPGRMAFVNASGEMYTCALVEGFGEFRLGTVFEGSMDAMIRNPDLPHAVPGSAPHVEQGCAGCPPLMAQYFEKK